MVTRQRCIGWGIWLVISLLGSPPVGKLLLWNAISNDPGVPLYTLLLFQKILEPLTIF